MDSKHISTDSDHFTQCLLDSKEICDITFLVGEKPAQKHFPASRSVVSAVSPAFFRLCYNVPRNGLIKIPSGDPDDFQVIISHIYEKKIKIDSLQHAWNLLPTTKNYGLKKLEEICRNYIIESIDIKNACSIFEEGQDQEDGNIILESFKFMTENAKYIFNVGGLIGSHASTVEVIVRQDCINVESEQQLFSAILEWARKENMLSKYRNNSNTLREIIEPFLPHIRFLQMKYCQLIKKPIFCDILTKEEVFSIIKNKHDPGSCNLPPWCSKNSKKRNVNYEFIEKCWKTPSWCVNAEDKLKSCKKASTVYRTKKGLFLSGVGFRLILPSFHVSCFLAVISVKTEGNVETIRVERKIGTQCFHNVSTTEEIVNFKTPVYVRCDQCFEISVEVDNVSLLIQSCKLPSSIDNGLFDIIENEEEKDSSCFSSLRFLWLT